MENIDKSSPKIDIFRHGKALYEQEEISLDKADDLTKDGIEAVEHNAEKLSELIDPNEEVAIWSSPKGRSLHTAKIIENVLKKKGVNLRKSSIQILKELTEIKNFSWKLFEPLVFGGEVEFAGKKFFIDKNETNPKGLNYDEYFNSDEIKKIPIEIKQKLPDEYVKEIEGFEDFFDVTKRIIKPLSRIKKLQDKSYRIIIVTHDALTGFIANIFSNGEKHGINPGEFINLEMRENKLIATKIGDTEDKNNDKDVVDEFKKRTS